MFQKKYYAHSREGRPPDEWHLLEDHLISTAQKAHSFAVNFHAGDWAYLAGLWHDLGKYSPSWQAYLCRQNGIDLDAHIEGVGNRPNHSTAGAVLAMERFKQTPFGRVLAYLIAGHHAGLPDWMPDTAGGDLQNRLFNTLTETLRAEELDLIRRIPATRTILEETLPKSLPLCVTSKEQGKAAKEYLHLWIRMLFSTLVDADFLDTEAFMNSSEANRRGQYPTLCELQKRFCVTIERIIKSSAVTDLNLARSHILKNCQAKANLAPGFFTLTVPTGGGKTLSSMAFALLHALKHDKKRIIMAIPYTSIIEQTASVLREALGEDAILEHHSSLDPDQEDRKSRLASENWDAPVIVTTNVQLFESLLASRASSCRKLHNIVNSVIILDEAQMLPPEYLMPTLSALKGLVQYFGVTVVLCTATQPALNGKIGSGTAIFEGLPPAIEIVDQKHANDTVFKRSEIFLPDRAERIEWPQLAAKLSGYEQVLCIVNTRKDCQILHRLMPEGTIHLSANMCGEERSEVIADVKKKLSSGTPIRVISTQLVEAGVDIDFPVVFRALAGLDSIAQAAGRCNREGKLNHEGRLGKVFVFYPPQPSPSGLLRKGEDASREILTNLKMLDLHPDIYRRYFETFYRSVNSFDKPKMKQRLIDSAQECAFQFRTFAQDVRFVDDREQRSIVVYYEGEKKGSAAYIDQLRHLGSKSGLVRKLQRFIVNVPVPLCDRLAREGHVENIHGYWVQRSTGLYQKGYGLLPDPSMWGQEVFLI